MPDTDSLAPIIETDPGLSAWTVDSADFPVGGTTADVLRFAIRYAVLAPSSHNSQPWQFGIQDAHLDLLLDESHGLPISDPEDREAVMSCGAAMFNLRLALAHFGYETLVEYQPEPKDPALLARVRLDGAAELSVDDQRLFAAIPHRHTSRAAYADRSVPPELMVQIGADAALEGAWLHTITEEAAKETVAELVADGDKRQMVDRRFRRELASWMRTNRSQRLDGMRGYAVGLGEMESLAEPIIIRRFESAHGRAAHDREIAAGSPALAILGTDDDQLQTWLRAGQALQRILLRCRVHDVSCGFLNQPIEVDALRAEVARLTDRIGYPQLILRLGYGPEPMPEPRRRIDDVMVPDSE